VQRNEFQTYFYYPIILIIDHMKALNLIMNLSKKKNFDSKLELIRIFKCFS
jgi:hypothetical protein